MSKITECPICGGEIQATRETYLSGLTLDHNGDVLFDGYDAGEGDTTAIYCANDHSHEEIIEALKAKEPADA